MSSTVDVFFSFRSPYSYLAMPELLKLRDDYAVEVSLKPVLPIALRAKDALFGPGSQQKARYIFLDCMRRAQYLGMKMEWPSPDPIVQDLATFSVAEEQPYIYRLTALGIEAERRGKGIDLAFAVSQLIFGGTRDWDQGDKLARAVASAGLKLQDMEAAIEQYDYLAEVEQNQKMLEEAGHWGVPTMVFRGEPFFGQDRIDTLRWRLDQFDLAKS
jgi:2-hydroxychromene-2-carboxylate isomerase